MDAYFVPIIYYYIEPIIAEACSEIPIKPSVLALLVIKLNCVR
jgi:hypothetical protein